MCNKQKIIDILKVNKEKISKIYKISLCDDINKKKFNIAQALYANDVEFEDVLLMVDTTLFSNGKNGVIISENGYYSREFGDNYYFYFSEVDKIETRDKREILVTKKDGTILVMKNILEEGFIDVLKEILSSISHIIKKDNTKVEKVEDSCAALKFLCFEEELSKIKSIISKMDKERTTFTNEINGVKLANAINAFAPKTNKKNVLAFMNLSVFGSGKEGIIFEYDKIVYKYSNNKFIINYRDYISSEINEITETNKNTVCKIRLRDDVEISISKGDFISSNKEILQNFIEFFDYIKQLYIKYNLYKYEKVDNTFEGNIDRILKKYQTTLTTGVMHLRSNIDEEKFNKAKKIYAKNVILDQTYLFAESSFFGSAKNGSILTFWGIYSRDFGENVTVYFADIDDMNGDGKNLYLTLKNGTKLKISNDVFNEDKLLLLLKDIITFYKDFANNPHNYDLTNCRYDYIEILNSFGEELKNKDIKWIKQQFDIGNPYAGIEIANRYRVGIDVKKDINRSIEILNSLQSAVANRILGEIYYNGETGEKDYSFAEKCFKESVKLGDVESEVWIANFYFLGINRNVNYTEAFSKYKLIIDSVQEDKLPISIKTNIGVCYRFAYGCEQNFQKAAYWLNYGVDCNSYYKYLIAELYVDIDTFIDKAPIGVEYLNELCAENYNLALSKLGELYFLGKHTEINNEKAFKLFKRACDLEQVEGYYYFGLMHTLDYYVEVNYEIAFEYINKAAEKLFVPALRDIGLMYQYGIGISKDISKAKKYFDKASELGDDYSKEWKDHTKKFLNKIKLINNCIYDETIIEFDKKEDDLIWKSSTEKNIIGLHKIINDYPELVKYEFVNCKIKKGKNKFEATDKAIKFGTQASNIASTANITKNFGTFFGSQGQGNAAEYADHVSDLLKFKNAKWLGTNNAIHGADRLVNGQLIQTKFCKDYSALKFNCLQNGEYKYIDQNTGKPMILEVPKDKVNDAIRMMTELYGEEGKNLVKASSLDYKQAYNVAKFGNIDSLIVDSKLGIVNARNAMGITIVISYATSLLSGGSAEEASKRALNAGVKTFGVAFCSSVMTSQLSKTVFINSIEVTDKLVGSNVRNVLTKATQKKGSQVITEKMAKNMLKSNIVASIATTTVLSSADIGRLIAGRISKEQLCKNVSVTAAGVAGGSAGFYAGAAIGSFILPIPGVGTFVGGMVGASLAGMASSNIVGITMNEFIKNDGDVMLEIFNKVFQEIAEDYLLATDEIEYVIDRITENNTLSDRGLRDIYASSEREKYCDDLITPIIEEVCELRNFIVTPPASEMIIYAEDIIETEFSEDLARDQAASTLS
ncbi:MAG TPA: tetratricopeptide repeat protein [Clostridium sp.]|uniref:tetratricopeptide repeat protein n=1 Tax=Clostridium sp. TaxID=1506 RepID=UPI002F920F51